MPKSKILQFINLYDKSGSVLRESDFCFCFSLLFWVHRLKQETLFWKFVEVHMLAGAYSVTISEPGCRFGIRLTQAIHYPTILSMMVCRTHCTMESTKQREKWFFVSINYWWDYDLHREASRALFRRPGTETPPQAFIETTVVRLKSASNRIN